MSDVYTGVKNIHQITVADRIPGIAHGILGKADVDAGFVQFLDACQAAAFGVVVKTSCRWMFSVGQEIKLTLESPSNLNSL